jgi:hypothetical protein
VRRSMDAMVSRIERKRMSLVAFHVIVALLS